MNLRQLALLSAAVAATASSFVATAETSSQQRNSFLRRLVSCYGSCGSNDDCDGQLACMNGVCNDDPDMGTHICGGGQPTPSHSPSPAPTPGHPSQGGVSKDDVIHFLKQITGNHIVGGQHNRDPNNEPAKWTDYVRYDAGTGKTPGLWGGDFLFQPDDVRDRQIMIDEAIKQWNDGSLVALMYHACPPPLGEPCQWTDVDKSKLSDDEWNDLITNGGNLNGVWKQRLDVIAPFLKQLQDAGVVPIFRLFHEMNGDWAWWTGRSGQDGSRRLFQISHDYLTQEHGLNNMVWNWNLKDEPTLADDIYQYWPGDNYVDVVSLDIWWHQQPQYDAYQNIKTIAAGRPIALAEVGWVPTDETLQSQPDWTWFMVWAEYIRDNNTKEAVQEVYSNPRVWSQGDFHIKP